MEPEDIRMLDLSACTAGDPKLLEGISGRKRPASMYDYTPGPSLDIVRYEAGLRGALRMFGQHILGWELQGFGNTHNDLVSRIKQDLEFLKSEFAIDISGEWARLDGLKRFSAGIARPEDVNVASISALRRRWVAHVASIEEGVQALLVPLTPGQSDTFNNWRKPFGLSFGSGDLAVESAEKFIEAFAKGLAPDGGPSADFSDFGNAQVDLISTAEKKAFAGKLAEALDLMSPGFALIQQELKCLAQVRELRVFLMMNSSTVGAALPEVLKEELFFEGGTIKKMELNGGGEAGDDEGGDTDLPGSQASPEEWDDYYDQRTTEGAGGRVPSDALASSISDEAWERKAAAEAAEDDLQGRIWNEGVMPPSYDPHELMEALDEAIARNAEREREVKSSRSLSAWERQELEDDLDAELNWVYRDSFMLEIERDREVRGS